MGLVILLRGDFWMFLDVSDVEFLKFHLKVAVFHCSYYWSISAVHHLHYFLHQLLEFRRKF